MSKYLFIEAESKEEEKEGHVGLVYGTFKYELEYESEKKHSESPYYVLREIKESRLTDKFLMLSSRWFNFKEIEPDAIGIDESDINLEFSSNITLSMKEMQQIIRGVPLGLVVMYPNHPERYPEAQDIQSKLIKALLTDQMFSKELEDEDHMFELEPYVEE